MPSIRIRKGLTAIIAAVALASGTPAMADPSDKGGDELHETSTHEVDLFQAHAEYPHVTRGQASGHGDWTTPDADLTSTKAHVESWLQIKSDDGKWRAMSTGTPVNVYPGGGKGKRGVAKVTCKNTRTHLWKVVGYVNLPGNLDTPLRPQSPPKRLACGV